MFSCGQFLEEFGKYLEGEAAAELRQELEAHLAQCRTCQVLVDTTGKTVKIVTETGDFEFSEALPDSFVLRIADRIRAAATRDSDPNPKS